MNTDEIKKMFSSRALEMIAKWPESNADTPEKIPQANPEIVIDLARALNERKKITSILDLGGGFGRWVPFWMKAVGVSRYTLIEPVPEFAAEAERRFEPESKVEIMCADLIEADHKLGQRRWDLTFTFTALEHVPPDQVKTVAEILRKRCKRLMLIEMVKATNAAGFCEYVFKHDYHALFGKPSFERMVDGNKALMLWEG